MGLDEKQYYHSIQECDIPGRSHLYSKESERYKSALNTALDIRKYEIQMYWERAKYFWTFISIVYGGYFYSLKELVEKNPIIPFILMVLATFLSLSWHCVIRGSKFWQNNWEHHVDLLENIVHGPIYKTIIFSRNKGREDLLSPFPFSASKINQSLSVAIVTMSLILVAREFSILIGKIGQVSVVDRWVIFLIFGYACFFCYKLFSEGKSDLGNDFFIEYNDKTKKRKGIFVRRVEIEK